MDRNEPMTAFDIYNYKIRHNFYPIKLKRKICGFVSDEKHWEEFYHSFDENEFRFKCKESFELKNGEQWYFFGLNSQSARGHKFSKAVIDTRISRKYWWSVIEHCVHYANEVWFI